MVMVFRNIFRSQSWETKALALQGAMVALVVSLLRGEEVHHQDFHPKRKQSLHLTDGWSKCRSRMVLSFIKWEWME